MRILNIGCGTRISPHCINMDNSILLKAATSSLLSMIVPLIMGDKRYSKFKTLDRNHILVHDLRRRFPFDDSSIDAVYSCHFIEHIDRDKVDHLFHEMFRVLKPRGIVRIVVPDLEILCRNYLRHLELCRSSPAAISEHDKFVGELIEQCVRREAHGSSQQRPLRRTIENILLGDARARGETHQWMYDHANLTHLMQCAGFKKIEVMDYLNSMIPGWRDIGLDLDGHNKEYKRNSLYIEAKK